MTHIVCDGMALCARGGLISFDEPPDEIGPDEADCVTCLRARIASLVRAKHAMRDDPSFDATDAAHPAWWRGHDHGALKIALTLLAVARDGRKGGTFAGPAVETAAKEIELLRSRLEALAKPEPDRLPVHYLGPEWRRHCYDETEIVHPNIIKLTRWKKDVTCLACLARMKQEGPNERP